MLGRRARPGGYLPLDGYPAWLRQPLAWYDTLSEWQRVQYAVVAGLFLLACAGYLLGLGSTVLLQRVEAEEAAAAQAQAVPTVGPTPLPVAAAEPTPTLAPTPEPLPTSTPTPVATPT